MAVKSSRLLGLETLTGELLTCIILFKSNWNNVHIWEFCSTARDERNVVLGELNLYNFMLYPPPILKALKVMGIKIEVLSFMCRGPGYLDH